MVLIEADRSDEADDSESSQDDSESDDGDDDNNNSKFWNYWWRIKRNSKIFFMRNVIYLNLDQMEIMLATF